MRKNKLLKFKIQDNLIGGFQKTNKKTVAVCL